MSSAAYSRLQADDGDGGGGAVVSNAFAIDDGDDGGYSRPPPPTTMAGRAQAVEEELYARLEQEVAEDRAAMDQTVPAWLPVAALALNAVGLLALVVFVVALIGVAGRRLATCADDAGGDDRADNDAAVATRCSDARNRMLLALLALVFEATPLACSALATYKLVRAHRWAIAPRLALSQVALVQTPVLLLFCFVICMLLVLELIIEGFTSGFGTTLLMTGGCLIWAVPTTIALVLIIRELARHRRISMFGVIRSLMPFPTD